MGNYNLITLILPVKNEECDYKSIFEEFEELYTNKKKRHKEELQRMTGGLREIHFKSVYKSLLEHFNMKHYTTPYNFKMIKEQIRYPCELFKQSFYYNMLTCEGLDSIQKNMFHYDDDEDEEMTGDENAAVTFLKNLVIHNKTKKFRIFDPYYKIPISEFNDKSIVSCCFPWIEDYVVQFFVGLSKMYSNFTEGEGNKDFNEKMKSETQLPTPFVKTLDPIHYFARYVKTIKDQSLNSKLDDESKKKLLTILKYLIETPKIMGLYSKYNQSLISFIHSKRRRNPQKRLYIQGHVPKNSSVIRKVYDKRVLKEGYEIGPISTFIHLCSKMMKTWMTVPPEYLGFVTILPLIITGNCHDRLSTHHFHQNLVGQPETGKNYLYDIIHVLLIPETVAKINAMSARARVTDEPQNGGINITNEPPAWFYKLETKLSQGQEKQLQEMKEILSSKTFRYELLDMHKKKFGAKTERTNVTIIVSTWAAKSIETILGGNCFWQRTRIIMFLTPTGGNIAIE